MKTKHYLLLLVVLFCFHVNGQDTLLYKSGGRVVVTILKENSSKVYAQNFNDTSIATRFSVYKQNLKEIRYQNDSTTFASMNPPAFYLLGQKHAKEFGSPSEVLINNSEYMRGYTEKSKKIKRNGKLGTITAVVSVVTGFVMIIAISFEQSYRIKI